MRAALLVGALALAGSAPLAAQEEPAPPAPPPALPAPGPIVLVTGSAALLERHGSDPLHPATELCLAPEESVVLASERVTVEIVGEGCHTAGEVEHRAFAEELRALHIDLIAQAQAEHDAALESGDAAAVERSRARLAEAERVGAQHGVHPEVHVVGSPATPARAARPGRSRTRTGAARASSARPPARPAAAPPRPIIFRLANASPAVLQRFPRGTLVQRSTALCLHRGEEATVVGSNGQTVSYTGPGCLRRQAAPTRDNIGGFTFG